MWLLIRYGRVPHLLNWIKTTQQNLRKRNIDRSIEFHERFLILSFVDKTFISTMVGFEKKKISFRA